MNDCDERVFRDYRAKLSQYSQADPVIKEIIEEVADSAARVALDAAYGGSHTDGGAGAKIEKLKAFLDGVEYAKTGVSVLYAGITKEAKNKKDKDYAKYLELRAKFE